MSQPLRVLSWAATASLSAPVWVGQSGPLLIRLPVGFQGDQLGFVHYLPIAAGDAHDPATEMVVNGGDGPLVRDIVAGQAHLMQTVLAGCGFLALRSLTGGVAQTQTQARTGQLILLREGW